MERSPVLLFMICIGLLTLLAGCTGQTASPAPATPVPVVTTAVPATPAAPLSFDAIPSSALSDSEKEDILYLQEAEKCEHDLNAALAAQRPTMPVFREIANITKEAMAADDVILARYHIPDPEMQVQGRFASQKLQRMYDDGVSAGSLSVTGAITASMKYDDLHIADLLAAIGRTDNDDLKFIYQQQLTISRNNIRLLYATLQTYNGTYVPTYITQSYYDGIITTPAEPVQLV